MTVPLHKQAPISRQESRGPLSGQQTRKAHMPQGSSKPTPRHTEDIARETNIGLFLDGLQLMVSKDPAAHGQAAVLFDQMADNSRRVEAELIRRQQVRIAQVFTPRVASSLPESGSCLIVFPTGETQTVTSETLANVLRGCRVPR